MLKESPAPNATNWIIHDIKDLPRIDGDLHTISEKGYFIRELNSFGHALLEEFDSIREAG